MAIHFKIKFVSLETDLGLESLRTSKLHYNPAFFLKNIKLKSVFL